MHVLCTSRVAESRENVNLLHVSTDFYSHGMHKRQSLDEIIAQLRTCRAIISDEQCNSGQIQQQVNLDAQCSNSIEASLAVNRCQRNSNGDYCNLATTYINEVRSAISVCSTFRNGCTVQCRNALILLRDRVGCCLNLEYNSTISPTFMYSSAFTSELWSISS